MNNVKTCRVPRQEVKEEKTKTEIFHSESRYILSIRPPLVIGPSKNFDNYRGKALGPNKTIWGREITPISVPLRVMGAGRNYESLKSVLINSFFLNKRVSVWGLGGVVSEDGGSEGEGFTCDEDS